MKSAVLASTLFIILAAQGDLRADDGVRPAVLERGVSETSLSELQATPEMWLYVQERERYDNPQAAVRRKAELRAMQRQQRIASMKAFGMSKSRPIAYNTVFNSYYSPYNHYPFLTIWPTYVVQPTGK